MCAESLQAMADSGDPILDVCIVSWRSRDLLRRCLRAVVGQPEVAEIVVVDNASGDGTVEMVRGEFPTVRLIANESNEGFAAGSNQAIRATGSPFVLLLNPDTEVQAGALRAMLNVFAEEERIGAVAAQLILPDGAVQRSCRGFPEPAAIAAEVIGLARLFRSREGLGAYRMRFWDHNSRRDVDQPMASALALRRAALDEVGSFDEGFPLYFNDVDLCCRLKQAGWRIVFEPKAKVTHHYGQSSTWQVRPSAILQSHRSLIRFYRKHYRGRICPCEYGLVVAAAWLTMWPRAGLAWLRGSPRPRRGR
jgi:N-acetylglucosaminyl-diphospho-decaprenol L-rhamnosyltransferase